MALGYVFFGLLGGLLAVIVALCAGWPPWAAALIYQPAGLLAMVASALALPGRMRALPARRPRPCPVRRPPRLHP